MGAAATDNRAYINPALLTWARQRAGLSQEQAAKGAGVAEVKLAAWEKGESRPTLRQAERLAQKFYVPFGYLFLSAAPQIDLELPDLRTVPGQPPGVPSPEFQDVLNDAWRKQEWFKEYRLEEGAAPLPFVGRYSLADSLQSVAADLEATLQISQKIRPAADKWETFLQSLMERAEQIGVLVLRNSIVGNNAHRPLEVAEFRGFVISDSLAPLIFLNGSDARAAQTFTLMHELAHLWVAESGVSNPEYGRGAPEQSNPVERFCDRVAAEALTPEQDFRAGWQRSLPLEKNIQELARHFKVGSIVILRRAYGLGEISREEFLDYYADRQQGVKKSGGGGDSRRNVLTRNSPTFTKALVDAVLSGRTTEREAARLLNLKVPSFDNLVSWLVEGRRG